MTRRERTGPLAGAPGAVCLGALLLCLAGCDAVPDSWIEGRGPLARAAQRLGLLSRVDRLYVARALERSGLAADPAAGTTAEPVARPDVLLIVLDTLRRDRLAFHGYGRDTMPGLSRWARGARIYDEARSTSSWTLPAHASLFTGLHPIEHGAHGVAWDADDPPELDANALPEEVPTLAGALREAGYATLGLAANRAYLGRALGLARGFDLWLCDDVPGSAAYPTADRVTDMALQLLDARGARPLFLFVNYMDAHQPILLREGHTPDLEAVDPELLPYTERWQAQTRRLLEEGVPLDEALVTSWSNGYDGELRFLDVHLARLLEGARERGIGDDDLVIVLSDHGELFGEHGLVEHSKHLFGELARIPLLVRGPGFEPGRDDAPVQIQDVPGWILDAAGLPRLPAMAPTRGLQVMELYWTRHKDLESAALRARFDRVLRAFVDGSRKRTIDDRGRERLYDLEADPDETRPLDDAPWAEGLREASDAWLRERVRREGRVARPDPKEIESLRALGYVE